MYRRALSLLTIHTIPKMARRSSRLASSIPAPTASAPDENEKPAKTSRPPKKAVTKSTTIKATPKASPKIATKLEPEIIPFPSEEAFDEFLAEKGTATPQGIWLKIAKKHTKIPTITYDQLIDTALCHGWIDGQRRSHCDSYFLQRVTPRRKGSLWSQRNVGKIAELTAKGRMRDTGLLEVRLAKDDGRWDKAYAGPKGMKPPADLKERLTNAQLDALEAMSSSARYSILWGIETAKKQETRQKRIDEAVVLLSSS
ncbi:hypothetical protein VHEMI03275 [[Torrubiella] hemipterigena]|uniref:OmdA domain containing protein n=1 Tax=[Torrubiella] hemipterigena TaxID=1531966 RepID=A0A0A1SY25_9HYPO|nr:hypothetical protein VHEMI03275 [[Torrubiella] hemipterigena]